MAEELGLDFLTLGADPGGAEPLRITGGVRHTGTRMFTGAGTTPIDDTSTGGVVIANNATATVSITYGFIEMADTIATGQICRLYVKGLVAIEFQNSTVYTTVPGTATKINVSWAAGVLTIENKTGADIRLNMHVRKLL